MKLEAVKAWGAGPEALANLSAVIDCAVRGDAKLRQRDRLLLVAFERLGDGRREVSVQQQSHRAGHRRGMRRGSQCRAGAIECPPVTRATLLRLFGVMIVLTRMTRILEVDEDERVAWVEPGVLNLDLSRAVAHLGFLAVAFIVVLLQAGAGIVADSDPEREYQETLHKLGALLRTLQLAEDGELT